MMQPKKSKYRKQHKGRVHGKAKGGTYLSFGEFGLKAIEPMRLTARQIEAARRVVTRHMNRQGNMWIRVFPDVPVSKKPLEVRMGSGKGSPEWYMVRIKPGRILFEVDGVSETQARTALESAAAKLPMKTKFIVRVG
jgi:large subunit ribosomal protein L16